MEFIHAYTPTVPKVKAHEPIYACPVCKRVISVVKGKLSFHLRNEPTVVKKWVTCECSDAYIPGVLV